GFLLTGKYRRALLALTHLRRVRQDDPLVPLLAASAFASLACQRHLANRHFFVANACAMLTCYAQLRAPHGCQEVAYNTARILHRLGLLRHAAAGYERALNAQPEGETAEQRQRNDLRPTAAHNLLVLYKSVGNEAMVSRLLREHLVIH
uniref:TPR_REGION domain-containing protein n=1 Tax=Macrostomum lignano TaxID=282301 RepID=A0A1I8G0Q3_9PLAT